MLRAKPAWTLPGVAAAISLGCVLGLAVILFCESKAPKAPLVTIRNDQGIKRAIRPEPLNREPSINSQPTEILLPTHLLFVGDIMLDRKVASLSDQAKDLAYPFKKLPSNWFDQYDYAIANLEGVVTDKRRPPEKDIDFLFRPTVAAMLKAQGIDAVSQANNHSLDQGREGYDDSVRHLREAGLLTFGHQVDDGPVALATTTIDGVTVAFLGFNDTDNPVDKDKALKDIQLAKQSASTTIVFMHWGIEYKDRPSPAQQSLAHWFIDNGVDAIIGGHPHWVQGMERYKNRPILYSLGNFIFDQDFSEQTRQGMALAVTINADKTLLFQPLPIRINQAQAILVEGEEKKKRLDQFANISQADIAPMIREGSVFFDLKP